MNRKQRRQQQKNQKSILSAGASGKTTPIPQALEMMVSSYESGDRAKAYKIADNILTAIPDDIDVLHFAGTVALELGQFEDALKHLNKAVAIKPDHAEAWNGIGHAHLVQGNIEPGVIACQKAAELLKDIPEAHYNLGTALSAAERADEAIESFQNALTLKPAYPEALNNMGNALQTLGRFDEAQSAFRQTLEINPNFKGARFNLANALMASRQVKDAITAYQDSIKAEPQHLASYNVLAAVYSQVGQYVEAADIYRQAIAINPNLAELHNNLGVVLQECGQKDDAADCFKRAFELDPQNAGAAFNLHATLFDDHNLEAAIANLGQVLSADPAHERAHVILGALLDHTGNTAEAEAHFEELPRDPEGYHPALDSWNYIKDKRNAKTRWFATAADTLRHSLSEATVTGAVLEFGVRYGTHLRLIAANADQSVHGFDSFQELSEDWRSEGDSNNTTAGTPPEMPENVILHAGWLDDTVPAYINESDEHIRFMHIDCNHFSPTITIFETLAPRIVTGSVIVFDKYLMVPNWREGEFKGFQETVLKHGWEYEYIAFSLFAGQAGIRIISI